MGLANQVIELWSRDELASGFGCTAARRNRISAPRYPDLA